MSATKKNEKRYRCISCSETFTVKAGKKPRCPSCMSIHSVEPVAEKDPLSLPSWWKHAAVAVGVAALAVGGYFLYEHLSQGPAPVTTDPATLGAVESKRLMSYLDEEQIEDENMIDPFSSGEPLATFADKHTGFGSAQKKASGIYRAIIDLKGKGAYTPFIPRQSRKTPVKSAGDAFEALSGDGKPELYSLELAALFTKAARLAGLACVVVEVVDYPDSRAPLDPSGNFGHFASVVYSSGSYEGELELYDLHQGRTQPGSEAEIIPLRDAEVVAHMLNHKAVRLVSVKFDAKEALIKLEDALILSPESPQFHTLQALIYVTSGGIEEGKDELRKAMQIRTDAAWLVKWGAILLAEDETEEAIAQIRKAIDLKPDYALAHASLAMSLLAEDEIDEANHELNLAKEMDPADPLIPVYESSFYLATGRVDKALKAAERAYEQNFKDPQTGLLLANIYAQTGHKDKMRVVLQEIRENEDLPAELISFIDAQLGEVSYDDDDDDDDLDLIDDDDDDDDDDDLALDKPGIGEKPSEGFLTGGSCSGLGLRPGGGNDPFGLSLKKGGGLLSGGN
ncbi:MAG: tetratricopeptide repeat protein [Deltaproteobacteria bacterium]|nr:tetratricopeptide repeat protein [Deltaproteobacteria bacterium]